MQPKAAKASYTTATTSLEEASEPNTEPVLAVSKPVQHVSAPEFTASVQDATTPVPVVIAPVQCQSLLQKGSCMSVLIVD